jgi:hypothetical protein
MLFQKRKLLLTLHHQTQLKVDTYTDPETGDIYQVYKPGKRLLLSKGTKKQMPMLLQPRLDTIKNKQQLLSKQQKRQRSVMRLQLFKTLCVHMDL